MNRLSIIFIALAGMLLAACDTEPAKRAIARGDHDSVRGAVWTAFVYETPYQRGSASYEFVILHDYDGLRDNYKGNRTIEQVQQDFAQEMIEIGLGLCGAIGRAYQGLDIEDLGTPFVNFYIDCR